jgi:hypothetical protein
MTATTADIDLTPPRDTLSALEARYLHENFQRIREIIDALILGGGGYTDEQAQDALGNFSVDTNTIDVVYNDAAPSFTWNARLQMSVVSDVNGIKLSGDVAAPGNSMVYGTDAGGTKGWYAAASGGSGLTSPQVLARGLGA